MTAQKLSSQELIKAIVAAGGRVKLVAERTGMAEGEVVTAVTADQATLAEQLRTRFILELYDTLMNTQIALMGVIEDMSPGDIARTYAAMSSAFAALTSKPSEDKVEQPVDINAARDRLAERLDKYAERRLRAEADESAG